MRTYLQTAILVGAVVLLWMVHFILPALPDPGDGVYHYQIARFSWQHPELLLDHWGKPLFTILASPFAQLGFKGMVLFNLILFAISAAAINSVIGKKPWSLLLTMVLMLFAPMYVKMIYAGMTEVLFGTVAVVSTVLVYRKRYISGALLASLLPYCRPEYVVFMPLLTVWLVYKRQWKAIPMLLAGSLAFAVFGWLLLGDPLWYIHNNPYTGAADIYGSGSLWHFLRSAQHVWGLPFLLLYVVGVGRMFFCYREEWAKFLFIFSFGTAMGVLVVHSILWWQGLRGSLGLVRVLATVVPLMTPLVLLGGDWLLRQLERQFKWKWTRTTAIVLLLIWGVVELKNQHPLPTTKGATEQMLEEAATWLNTHRESGQKVSYLYPYFGYASGLDPYDENETWLIWGLDQQHPTLRLEPGDWVVWDAHFGPNEGKLDLKKLSENDQFTLRKVVYPPESFKVLGGRVFEVYIYQVAPRPPKSTRTQQVAILEAREFNDAGKYADLFRNVQFPPCDGTKQLIEVKGGVLTTSKEAELHLCFTQRKNGTTIYHRSYPLITTEGWNPFSMYFEVAADKGVAAENVIYILNPKELPLEVAGVALNQRCMNW